MLINSELPLTMLKENKSLNEYDFVLFHLYQQYPEYRDYYKEMRRSNPKRLMILDNSAYEYFVKGETLDQEAFVSAILDLMPDFYILPDTLMDKDKTLKDSFEFLEKYEVRIIQSHPPRPLNVPKPLAVAQGNSEDELFDCLLKYKEAGIRQVALPFHNSFYKEIYADHSSASWRIKFGVLTDDHRYALGRIQFVQHARLLLKKFEHVHLLGSHCPYEKLWHPDCIKTIDTGYPVKCGIEGHELFREPSKPNIIIDQFMTVPLTDQQRELIISNVIRFKEL